MLIKYEGYNLIVDPNTDFIILEPCYNNGCNCSNCTERIIDGCIIDDIPMGVLTFKQN